MQIIDLAGEFIAHDAYRSDYASYERLYPQLFHHYFTYWSDRNLLPIKSQNSILLQQRDCLMSALPSIDAAFQAAGFRLDDVTVALFVGVGTSNGHAMKDGGKMVVWLPVETYPTSLSVRVFVAHEIAHAIHYVCSPQYYFENDREVRHFGRLLITEGLATYLSQHILGMSSLCALWADFLPEGQAQRWLELCQEEEQRLAAFALERFSASSDREFFQYNDSGDIYRFRAGYYLGLRVIERIVEERHIAMLDMLSTERTRLDERALEALRQLAQGR